MLRGRVDLIRKGGPFDKEEQKITAIGRL